MLPFRVPGAGVPLYPSIRLVGTPLILGNGAGEYVPPAPSIAAPLDVTWVDGTNPVECVMNVKWTGTGAVEVGDIPQVRYNGGGTIYDGDAVTVLAGNPTFSGLPTQPSGTGYAQYRYVRDPGGPGEIIGAWSSASEGAFDIVASEPPVNTYITKVDSSTSGSPQSLVADLGLFTEEALLVLRGTNTTDLSLPSYDPSIASATITPDGGSPISCTIVAKRTTNGEPTPWIAQAVIPAGTDLDNATVEVTYGANPFANDSISFNKIVGLASTTPTDTAFGAPGSATSASVAIDVLADGIILAVAVQKDFNSASWTASDESFVEVNEYAQAGAIKASADATASADGSSSVQVDFSGSAANVALVAGSWR